MMDGSSPLLSPESSLPGGSEPASAVWPVPRIGGTAMPGGVHFSTGNYGTAPPHMLFLTGVAVIALGAGAMVMCYLLLWLLGALTGLPLGESLMGIATAEDFPTNFMPVVEIGQNLFIFLCFLVVLRLSPLSGYHGAEHKVVHCLEQYGRLERALARSSPRAHRRCGTTLLVGIIPLPLIALPLLVAGLWPAAILIGVLCWVFRVPVGAAIQQVFTTKEPTEHQLTTALEAAEKLINRWRQNPNRRLPVARSLWVRGFPQMLAGALTTSWFFQWISTQLPLWLDWGHVIK